MSQFERFVSEGNEKADELAKAGACWTKGLWQKQEQKRCSRKERRCIQLLQNTVSFHCMVVRWKDCDELEPQPEKTVNFRGTRVSKRSAERSGVRNQLEVWKNSKYMKVPGKCTGPKFLSKSLENGEGAVWEAMTWAEE